MTTKQHIYQFIPTHATVNSADGFKDGNTNPNLNDYEYDDNDFRVKKIENLFCEESERSSMILDRNKGIESITYNHLNLPTKITWPDNKSISYEYNAIGQKVSKSVRENNDSIKIVDYLDGFQYAGKVLQFFPHAEGYTKATSLSLIPGNPPTAYHYNYVYNHTDHLGNVRLSYSKDPQTGTLEILEENHYYPFGLKHGVYTAAALKDFRIDEMGTNGGIGGGVGEVALINVTQTEYQYKYNGKELQDELGLNMYAMDMRQYDPAIARWVVQDPVTHFDFSPYNAFDNNPVFWADPSGADAVNIGYDRVVDTNSFSGSATWSGGFREISGERKNDEFSANQNSSSNSNANSAQNLDNGDPKSGEQITIGPQDMQPKGAHVFSGLEFVVGEVTDYIIGEVFDYFGWNKDYQDEATTAASLIVSKGNPTKVSAKTSVRSVGPIKGHTKHGINQSISRDGRGVSAQAKLDAVKNPKKIESQSDGRMKYKGKDATVILNKDGKVITTYGKARN